jgi:hypothetical protein
MWLVCARLLCGLDGRKQLRRNDLVCSHELPERTLPSQCRTQSFAHTVLLPFDPKTSSPDRSDPELISDENDHDEVFHGSWDTDFGEGVKSILDIVHPDLTSPEMGEKLPTLLFPWRGVGSSGILSSYNHGNGRRTSVSSTSKGLYDGRQ